MARGIKPTKDRKQVRTISVQVRLNEYEYEELQTCLTILKDSRPISTFIRDIVNSKARDMQKDINSQFHG
jgi:hypothetical protein